MQLVRLVYQLDIKLIQSSQSNVVDPNGFRCKERELRLLANNDSIESISPPQAHQSSESQASF